LKFGKAKANAKALAERQQGDESEIAGYRFGSRSNVGSPSGILVEGLLVDGVDRCLWRAEPARVIECLDFHNHGGETLRPRGQVRRRRRRPGTAPTRVSIATSATMRATSQRGAPSLRASQMRYVEMRPSGAAHSNNSLSATFSMISADATDDAEQATESNGYPLPPWSTGALLDGDGLGTLSSTSPDRPTDIGCPGSSAGVSVMAVKAARRSTRRPFLATLKPPCSWHDGCNHDARLRLAEEEMQH